MRGGCREMGGSVRRRKRRRRRRRRRRERGSKVAIKRFIHHNRITSNIYSSITILLL